MAEHCSGKDFRIEARKKFIHTLNQNNDNKSRADQISHANDSPPLQTWNVGPGAKPRRWAPLTRDTHKGIKRV